MTAINQILVTYLVNALWADPHHCGDRLALSVASSSIPVGLLASLVGSCTAGVGARSVHESARSDLDP